MRKANSSLQVLKDIPELSYILIAPSIVADSMKVS